MVATLSLLKEISWFFFFESTAYPSDLFLKFGHQECEPYSSNFAKNWYEHLADGEKLNFIPLSFQSSPAITHSFSRPYRPTVWFQDPTRKLCVFSSIFHANSMPSEAPEVYLLLL